MTDDRLQEICNKNLGAVLLDISAAFEISDHRFFSSRLL
jgi:hypothetical protein